jgi:hypothetical protein
VTLRPLYARPDRHQTRVVCGRRDCGAPFGAIKRAEQPFRVYLSEFGGPRSKIEYLEVAAGELYVEMLPGFLLRSDGFYDVSGSRLGHWRALGLPSAPRNARGEASDIVKGPVGARCARCRREQVILAGRLAIAQRE